MNPSLSILFLRVYGVNDNLMFIHKSPLDNSTFFHSFFLLLWLIEFHCLILNWLIHSSVSSSRPLCIFSSVTRIFQLWDFFIWYLLILFICLLKSRYVIPFFSPVLWAALLPLLLNFSSGKLLHAIKFFQSFI